MRAAGRAGGVARAGLGQHPHLMSSGREVSGGRGVRGQRGEPGWAGGEASRQGSSSGCEPGWREAARQPQKPPSPCEEVTQRQPPLPGGPHTFNSRPAARRCRLEGLEGLPGLPAAVIPYPPLSVVRFPAPSAAVAPGGIAAVGRSIGSMEEPGWPSWPQLLAQGWDFWGLLSGLGTGRDTPVSPSACPGHCQTHCQGVMWWGRGCRQCPSPGRVPPAYLRFS